MNRQPSSKVIKNHKERRSNHNQLQQKRQRTPMSIHNAASLKKTSEKHQKQRRQKVNSAVKNQNKFLQRKKTPKPDNREQSHDTYKKKMHLNMKQDLKMLISKNKKIMENRSNGLGKDKTHEVLKNIQKYSKLLKNIHDKEHGVQLSKKHSFKENTTKNLKSIKKSSVQFNRYPSHIHHHQMNPQHACLKSSKHNNNHRYSLELDPGLQPIDQQTQLLMKSRKKMDSKKKDELRTQSRRESRQVIKVYEQYKKNFQESAKITNYNTNQSKNTSLFASQGPSHIIQSLSKSKSKHPSSIKKEEIEKMIKSQKESFQKAPVIEDRKRHLKFQKVHEIVYMPQALMKQLSQIPSNQLQNKFKRSKYFVMEVPNFMKTKMNKKEIFQEDPLQGCEITLIENNIFEQDSNLIQLQL